MPIELANHGRILAPVRLNFDEEFEKNVDVQDGFEFFARLRADRS